MPEQYPQQPYRPDEMMEDEISLLDLAITLAKYKKQIIVAPVIVGILTALASLVMPSTYTADTQILPPQQQSSAASMIASQLGALGGMAGMAGSSLGIKNPNDTYIAMLKSRSLQDNMIKRFQLEKVYKTSTPGKTRASLTGATKVTTGKDGLITVSVEDRDPKRAAALANGYIEELQHFTQVLAVTEASQRRLFFEKQLQQTEQELSAAEVAMKQMQGTTGLTYLNMPAAAQMQAAAALQAQITMKEVQLGAMRTFATGSNPEYLKTQQEVSSLRSQLSKVETGGVSGGKVPASSIEYARKVRDVKYYQALYDLLVKQLDMARLDEAKDGSIIQVIDKAIPPEQRSKPKRAQMVLIAALAAGFLTVLWAFINEALQNAKKDTENGERLKQLQHLLRWK
ncbi:MAG: lipopolysaccharide biosynthesis protein [Chlorobiaceae bacterium]|nr:lipopolysaccharide biosynthesis protein [Chlorobiaceae bacterium]